MIILEKKRLCDSESERKIESELHGTTLRVYWYLLEHTGKSSIGIRELQRALGFSSPTRATYHLEKLANLGLVEKTQDGYALVREVKVGVLRQFIKLDSVMLPRYFFYATLFTTLLILYIVYLFSYEHPSISSAFAMVFGTLGVIMSWYETFKTWKQRT
jgi:DNA-binding transcriptional ArsR family regulator